MGSFGDIGFSYPGYPITRGFIVPCRVGEELTDVLRVDEKGVASYSMVLEKMREFISESLNLCNEWGVKLTPVKRLELIGDLIAFYLRIPFIREVIPGVMPTPLKIYLLDKLGILGEEPDPMQDPLSFVKSLYEYPIKAGLLKPFSVLNDRRLSDEVERCWLLFPADTRPGLNTSSLLAHLMLTSAIAWALAVERGLDREHTAKLRLAAMIHDLGKPFNYRRHVNASVKVARKLLEGIVPECGEIVDYVERHHSRAESAEGRILREADELASATDRLLSLSMELIGRELGELSSEMNFPPEKVYGTGEEAWEFWAKVEERYPGSIERLTRKFLENLRNRLERFTKPVTLPHAAEGGENISREILMCLIDLGGIQSFITRFSELRCVEGASIVVDSIIMAQIPILINRSLSEMEIHYPVEATLYAAGGIIEFLIPNKLLNQVSERLELLKKKFSHGYPSIRYAWTNFSPDYTSTSRRLEKEMRLRKFSVERISREVDWSLMEAKTLCNICYERPAVKDNKCERCDELYEFGTQVHFKRRYEIEHEIYGKLVKPEAVFNTSWDLISKYIVELIAGHDWKELEKKSKGVSGIEWRDIAVVKLDGNLMAPFMVTSLSISDSYERSMRIDLALKKAFQRALDAVYLGVEEAAGEQEAQKAVLSTIFGLLYMGGDDALILCPSWLSMTMSWVLGKEFNLNLGNVRGLAIGVAVSHCRASIWPLISAAGKLVEEVKSAFRNNPEISGICFDIVEAGGSLTAVSAKIRLNTLRDEFTSVQPIPISGDGGSLESLFRRALVGLKEFSYEEVAKKSYLLSRMSNLLDGVERPDMKVEVEKGQAEAKKILSAIGECIRAANTALEKLPTSHDKVLMKDLLSSLVELYARRQLARCEGEGGEAWKYQVMLDIISLKDEKKRIPFSDVERFLKIIGGGII